MGQYGNQPDFGTRANNIIPEANAGDTGVPSLNSAALYIGTGGVLICDVVGGNTNGGTYTIFNNIPDGTFFPVIVNRVWGSDGGDIYTTCSDIVALY
jgi:hypothetical protein